ncbi:sterol desaturase family protein [Pedobacter antarcticus]|uniref:Fatty acid hydroxylase n=2 Tax=Pedobacter antarcticus TaxID=34086 RepID=A0A081PG22_9SPHI|nr:sterol desaturase family protein [Pedobacter antarcticus]KEQ29645.1 fatty acid hydroxylase [Pedobacter antarcticus 4BY]SDL79134.1 Sterol desaturase/sphingolipid hydroxylase, fatty acid hydroxylase superfamily [Pedobacter antarcticus]SFF00327.1 Sterol desaturase/sphingolipid hydroxylase, fatty acid hydroxylase superfamily [Pedobacter antarcticus]
MKKNFISNSSESIRMFKSSFLESLSKVHYYVPLIVYIPVISYLIYLSFIDAKMDFLSFGLWLLIGLFVWTISEYILHRFVFHFYPKSGIGKRIHFIFHGVHHDYPNDSKRLVMPPSASIPMALGLYFLFLYLLPAGTIYAFFTGFLIGYLIYDMVHYALHHANFKSSFWKKLKQHHMLHHYSDSTKGYGVSSAIWDKVLGSDFEKK